MPPLVLAKIIDDGIGKHNTELIVALAAWTTAYGDVPNEKDFAACNAEAKDALKGSGVKVASVASGFPAGLVPLDECLVQAAVDLLLLGGWTVATPEPPPAVAAVRPSARSKRVT